MPELRAVPTAKYVTLHCTGCGKALRLISPGGLIIDQKVLGKCECVWGCCEVAPMGHPHDQHLDYRESTPEDVAELILDERKLRVEEVVLKVCEANATKLVWVFCGYGAEAQNVTPQLVSAITTECWALQDGYGTQGFTPPQGYDWSGIRDSSEEAWVAMKEKVLWILAGFQISEVVYRIKR